ncbi:MAG TPA: antibiotic biosynthesis monooxygenase [Casimicrobiaceae bacterium]|nr:antibiotic biosynthesis monooxygenase [Casimicrobiaceae bacterium]
MVITVFRARVRPELQEEYVEWVARMRALAAKIPGFISHKGFRADDGERVSIVEFESEEAQRAWRMHPEHVAAQIKGRKEFYEEYRIQVCVLQRESVYPKR